jgi:hypothetical protein
MNAQKLKNNFRFVYVGGGVFCDKTIPKGEKANILHGNEVVKAVIEFVLEERQKSQKTI